LHDALAHGLRIARRTVDEDPAHGGRGERRALRAVGVRMVEGPAQLLAQARVTEAREPLADGQVGEVPPVEDAVEERGAAPPVERPHEGLRAQHRVDGGTTLARLGEEARLVLPALSAPRPKAHALPDDREPG